MRHAGAAADAKRARAEAFVVNSTADSHDAHPGDGVCADTSGRCTLRAAAEEANAHLGVDNISVPNGRYVLSKGALNVFGPTVISGATAAGTIVVGNHGGPVIIVSCSPITITRLTIEGGRRAVGSTDPGAGVFFTPCSGKGAKPRAAAWPITLTVTDSVLSGNEAGFYAQNAPIEPSVINALLGRDTFTGNQQAISTQPGTETTVVNTTITGNGNALTPAAVSGSGIALSYTTVSDNRTPGVAGDVDLTATVLDRNSPTNCASPVFGLLTSSGYNLSSDRSCTTVFTKTGDQNGKDPKLAPLADNGGQTPTEALLPGSPAIDHASPNCPPPRTDQRGVARPQDGDGDGIARCDIGAFEFVGQIVPHPNPHAAPPPAHAPGLPVTGAPWSPAASAAFLSLECAPPFVARLLEVLYRGAMQGGAAFSPPGLGQSLAAP